MMLRVHIGYVFCVHIDLSFSRSQWLWFFCLHVDLSFSRSHWFCK